MKLMKWNNEPVYPDFFTRFFNEDFDNLFGKRNCGHIPAANVIEKEGGFEIEFAVPGMKKEDFTVNTENGILAVSSEKETNKQDQELHFTRREFVYGSFSRSFTLPKSVNTEAIEGSYENGILRITLPKKEEAKTVQSRSISIS